MSVLNEILSAACDMKMWLLLNKKQKMLLIFCLLCFSFPYPNSGSQISCWRMLGDCHEERHPIIDRIITEEHEWDNSPSFG